MLLKELKELSPSQLDQEITVHIAESVIFTEMKSIFQLMETDDDGNDLEPTVVLQTEPLNYGTSTNMDA